MNRTALIEVGWAAIVPEPNLCWPDLPPGSVMEWLSALGVLAHEHTPVVDDLLTARPVVDVERYLAKIASIPTLATPMTTQKLFLLCADLRVWDMRLGVLQANDLEEWVIGHVNAAAAKAFRAMIDTLLQAQPGGETA